VPEFKVGAETWGVLEDGEVSVPPAAWPEQVEQMRERAHLSVENAALVTRYLIMVASRPAPPAQQSPPRR